MTGPASPRRTAHPPGAGDARAKVNGIEVALGPRPGERLSDWLRDGLGLVGTKVGCSAGDCGACTVLVDGEQACACLVPVGQCDGADILTVEGLAEGGAPSALQRAFVEHGAAQCGICTPGMLIAATDLLRRHPRPTEAQVLDGLAGVLCRCTGYRKIVEAVMAVAHGAVAQVADASPAAGAAVGARLPRLDGPAVTRDARRAGV
ncbi:MAG TPA: (2Fe-2S)-binding protein, partial [Burkholderiaceae bacterium]|nr:(2Fe-2S)-binding protein [Burkholderiaceae bacterium]